MAYTGIDKEIYDSGTHFRPLQEYTQQQWTPPAIMGQNTNAGITNTQAAGSYMGYPSYEAWLLAQGGGGGNGGGNDPVDNINRGGINQNLGPTNITDYESEAYGVGPTWAGSWARAKDAYSKLPTPGNLIMKGIRKWKENRDTKRAEEQRIKEIEVSQRSQDNAAAAGQVQRGGGAGDSSPSHMGGISQAQADAVGAANAAAGMSGWGLAQGGRIGMAKGKIPLPRAKTKMGFGDKFWGGIAGLSTLIKHPNLYKGFEKRTESGLRNIRDLRAARIAKYGKWGMRGARAGMSLMNPWTAVPFALGYGAKYAVGKAFDPYRDETGKIGAEGHAELARAARAREALMAQRNAARENRRAGGLAGLL